MRQSDQEISNRLSKKIFNRKITELNMDELFFVYQQRRWYANYRAEIVTPVLKAMKVTRLNGDAYWTIFDWFSKRIPTNDILSAIKECVSYARTNAKPINSINYFKRAVIRHYEKTSMSMKFDYGWGTWRFEEYSQFNDQNGKWAFDPFYGVVPNE